MANEAKILKVRARQIFDSRGNPTLEVDLQTNEGVFRAAVPSGASTGKYEALELRDGGKAYGGKGVTKAVENINTIIGPKLEGMDPTKQSDIDMLMVKDLDGTTDDLVGFPKKKLGANAILAVSLAVCRAGAMSSRVTLYQHIANLAGNKASKFVLPVPAFNIINGGEHAGNKLAMQEAHAAWRFHFMILPTGASSFKEAMQMGNEVYQSLKKIIKGKYGQDAANVGDEGGFAPNIQSSKEGLELVEYAMDVAASEFCTQTPAPEGGGDPGFEYDLFKKVEGKEGEEKKKPMGGAELLALYESFCKDYPMVSIEDPFDQDDWSSWAAMQSKLGGSIQVVGDDLLVTNPKRIQVAAEKKACNALLLKVNQIGTVTEAIDAVKLAKDNGWGVMTSHRSGERLAKYNQLLRIEEMLGANAVFAGKNFKSVAWE